MGKARPPKLDAIVLCRSIGTDPGRTRWDLQGVVRGRLESRTFPLKLQGLGVYLAMTGMQGDYGLAVEIAELSTGKVVAGTHTTSPKRVLDPLELVTECIQFPALSFEKRGRYACRFLANGELVHESVFEVDWPRPEHVQGQMSPQSFARGLGLLKEKEPGLDDGRLARVCGVEPEVLVRMSTTFEGLEPEQGQEILARICHHFRVRPEEFFESFE
ncbi:MAG: hypothetical protein ACHQ1G_08340 [Planctomycetota bacterium]